MFKRRLNEIFGVEDELSSSRATSPILLTCNSDSDVFRSVEVQSRPTQNQNVNVNL